LKRESLAPQACFSSSLLTFMHDYVCPKFIMEAMVRGEEGVPWTTAV
jgi:hypothetical protein